MTCATAWQIDKGPRRCLIPRGYVLRIEFSWHGWRYDSSDMISHYCNHVQGLTSDKRDCTDISTTTLHAFNTKIRLTEHNSSRMYKLLIRNLQSTLILPSKLPCCKKIE